MHCLTIIGEGEISYGQEMFLWPSEVSASAAAMVEMNNDKFGELSCGINTRIGGKTDGRGRRIKLLIPTWMVFSF